MTTNTDLSAQLQEANESPEYKYCWYCFHLSEYSDELPFCKFHKMRVEKDDPACPDFVLSGTAFLLDIVSEETNDENEH